MKINRIELTNFRNYSSVNIEFEKGINLIVGDNGVGKTNIVEAIHYLTLGKSFKTNEDKELIKFEEDFAKVRLEVQKKDKMILQSVISKDGKKVFYNDIELKKLSELSGKLNDVLFVPEDVIFFKDSPQVRRRFFDVHLSSMKNDYLQELSVYKNLLKERNALLKQENIDKVYLDVLTEKMIEPQFKITKVREQMVNEINEIINRTYKRLDDEQVELKLYYQKISKQQSFDEFKKELIKRYEDDFELDTRRKLTGIGIHRDDYKMYRSGREIVSFGSQGQNRIAALALKIAMFELIKEKTGEEPIMILDDVLSELDKEHQSKLLKLLSEIGQVFVTCAKEDELIRNVTTYVVSNNLVIRR